MHVPLWKSNFWTTEFTIGKKGKLKVKNNQCSVALTILTHSIDIFARNFDILILQNSKLLKIYLPFPTFLQSERNQRQFQMQNIIYSRLN